MPDSPLSLAIREEGEFVNAYIKMASDPKAMFLGSMNAAVLETHPELFEAWKQYMTAVLMVMLDHIGNELGIVDLTKGARFEERPAKDETEGSA